MEDRIKSTSGVHKIPFYDKFVYALTSGFSINIHYYVFTYYLTYFLVDVRCLPAALVGVILLFSRVFDVITDFLIGVAIDRFNFKSGKFRGFIKIALVPMCVFFPLIFWDINNMSTTVQIIWTVITYGTYGAIWTTIMYAPTNAQVTNMTKNVEDRGNIVGMREIFNNGATLIASAGFLPMVKLLGGGDENRGFVLATIVLGVVAMLCQIWNLAVQKKYELNPDGTPKIINYNEGNEPAQKQSLIQQLKQVAQNKIALIVLLSVMIMNMSMTIKNSFLIYQFKYCFMDEEFYSLAMVFFTVASILGALLISAATKLFRGSNRAYLATLILTVAVNTGFYALIRVMGYDSAASSIHFGLLFFIFVISGFLQGIQYGMPLILLSNAVDYGEWKNKRSDVGILFGLNSLSQTLGFAVGGFITGIILDMIKYDATAATQTPVVLNGILIGAIIIPVVMTALQFVCHLFYNLSDEEHARCVLELEAWKAQK